MFETAQGLKPLCAITRCDKITCCIHAMNIIHRMASRLRPVVDLWLWLHLISVGALFPDEAACGVIPERLQTFISSEQASQPVGSGEASVLIAELEEVIIGNRLAITSWQATVTADSLTGADGDKDEIMRVGTFVDGRRMRCDFHRRMPLKDRVDEDLYVSIESSNGTREYEYSETPDPLGLKFALLFRDVTQMRSPPTMERMIKYDPRAIGNFPNGALSPAYGPVGILKEVNTTDVDIAHDQLNDGTACLRVRKQLSNAGLLVYWASISEGLSIRRYVCDADDTIDPTYLEQTDTQVMRWKETEIWVPVATHYTQTYDKVLQVNEVARIHWHSINESLDPDLFEPVTFPGLDAGIHVYDVHEMLGPKRRMIWNGKEIVDEDVRQNRVDPAGGVASITSRILLLNSAVFIIIAGVFLWRSIRTSNGIAKKE